MKHSLPTPYELSSIAHLDRLSKDSETQAERDHYRKLLINLIEQRTQKAA